MLTQLKERLAHGPYYGTMPRNNTHAPAASV